MTSKCLQLVNEQFDALVVDIAALYKYSVDDFRERLEVRTYNMRGPLTTFAVHDRTLGTDLSPRLTYGFEGVTFVVRRVP